MTDRPEGPGEPEAPLVTIARFSGHGLTIALATGLFLFVGWWLDSRFGTTPLLTIVGALVGAAAGFYSMLQHLLFLPREAEERRAAREREADAAGGAVEDEDPDRPGGRT